MQAALSSYFGIASYFFSNANERRTADSRTPKRTRGRGLFHNRNPEISPDHQQCPSSLKDKMLSRSWSDYQRTIPTSPLTPPLTDCFCGGFSAIASGKQVIRIQDLGLGKCHSVLYKPRRSLAQARENHAFGSNEAWTHWSSIVKWRTGRKLWEKPSLRKANGWIMRC